MNPHAKHVFTTCMRYSTTVTWFPQSPNMHRMIEPDKLPYLPRVLVSRFIIGFIIRHGYRTAPYAWAFGSKLVFEV